MLDFLPLEYVAITAFAAAVLAVFALVLALIALRRARQALEVPLPEPLPMPQTVRTSDKRRQRLDLAGAIRHLAVVRYDAFGDMGGALSWSMALLDDAGDGVVITAIHGRSDARTYAKDVQRWETQQPLSPEEREVIETARGRIPAQR